jgi:hypothetical protein
MNIIGQLLLPNLSAWSNKTGVYYLEVRAARPGFLTRARLLAVQNVYRHHITFKDVAEGPPTLKKSSTPLNM